MSKSALQHTLILLLISALSGCDPNPIPLVVEVRGDFAPSLEVDRIELTVEPTEGGLDPHVRSVAIGPADSFRDGVRVAEIEDVVGGRRRMVARALLGERLVVSRAVAIDLRQATLVTVFLTRSCVGVDCSPAGSDFTCVDGQCVPEACVPARPETCEGFVPACTEDDQCDAADCASALCADGVCVAGGTCPLGAICHPIDGCVATDLPSDAGPRDAGPPDAGPPDAGPPDAGGCGASPACDDGIACTVDSCVDVACTFTPSNAACGDGMVCDPSLGCVACLTDAACDDSVPCTTDTCDAGMCVNSPEDTVCRVGRRCSATLGCVECVTPGDCDDGVDCTSNVCDASGACSNPPIAGRCGVGLTCEVGGCCEVSPCQPVSPQCGCLPGNSCYLASGLRCLPAGSGASGQPCVLGNACAPGLHCGDVYDLASGGPTGERECRPYCETDADCPGGEGSYCHYDLGDGIRGCTIDCRPDTQEGCGANGNCVVFLEGMTLRPTIACAGPIGSGGNGAACASLSDCQKGYFCEGGSLRCRESCRFDPPGDPCTVGSCAPLPFTVDGETWGLCV
ncbi:MAG: hypothetical protein AB8I08_33200 [Sandaracinaceae bacterium]